MANPLLLKKGKEFASIRFQFRLVGQSLSALISTSFQHSSAGSRSHSLSKAVYFASLSFLGLISSFHNYSPAIGFLSFSVFIAVRPTITLFIITQKSNRRQAILPAFFVFGRFFALFYKAPLSAFRNCSFLRAIQDTDNVCHSRFLP